MENESHRRLLEAVSFTARAHQGQLRKDRQTPYASHPFRVCLIVCQVFGIAEPDVLSAALLHDTIEDTPADFDDLAERFGTEVATWAGLLTKDMRLPEAQREAVYKEVLAMAPWQVKVCKLADIYDNLLDSSQLAPAQRQRTLRRSREYLAALDTPGLPPPVQQAQALVAQLLQQLQAE